jgi:hypothetical protein
MGRSGLDGSCGGTACGCAELPGCCVEDGVGLTFQTYARLRLWCSSILLRLPLCLAPTHTGADVHARDREGYTPLGSALRDGNTEVQLALLCVPDVDVSSPGPGPDDQLVAGILTCWQLRWALKCKCK